MHRGPRRMALLCVIVLLVCAVIWRRSRPRFFSNIYAATQNGAISASLESGGRSRAYLVHLPPSYRAGTPLPLVVVLHGGTESNSSVERLSGMSAKADQEHFIAVYPSGIGRLPTWNAGNCCGPALKEKVDDIGFLRDLLEKLKRDYTIDAKRVYFTGISNGAMMSYRAACEMADQVAAIAPVEGALNVDCRPSARVSVIVFHGTADRLVPFQGGSTPFQIGPQRSDNSVAGAIDFWVKRDGCAATPKHEETAEVHIDKYSGCQDGAAVALYAIQGGHHMWPGVRLSGNDVPATDLMWSFFAAHPKP